MTVLTNREFAEKNVAFKRSCIMASEDSKCKAFNSKFLSSKILKPTKRQASKYCRGFGAAYKHMINA